MSPVRIQCLSTFRITRLGKRLFERSATATPLPATHK